MLTTEVSVHLSVDSLVFVTVTVPVKVVVGVFVHPNTEEQYLFADLVLLRVELIAETHLTTFSFLVHDGSAARAIFVMREISSNMLLARLVKLEVSEKGFFIMTLSRIEILAIGQMPHQEGALGSRSQT